MIQNKITESEMIDAINRSGYLIEQRIERSLLSNSYVVQTSDAYLDTET